MAKPSIDLPTVKYLNECFTYDENKGVLIWKSRPQNHFKTLKGREQFNSNYAGTIAGSKKKDIKGMTFNTITLKGKNCQQRRIIWKMIYGKDPDGVVYNINGIGADDRKENLAVKTMAISNTKPKIIIPNALPEGIQYDRERIMWGSDTLGWFNRKIDAIKELNYL
jgi:hypothetical protein